MDVREKLLDASAPTAERRMKMRLVDADDLWSEIMALPHNGDMISSEEVEQEIRAAPTVDAVEVVRCKDCVHWYDKEETCLKIYSDGDVSPYAWQFRASNDFCSYGERRADGKDA